jgi:multiple sugar transport system ATP-binding protein
MNFVEPGKRDVSMVFENYALYPHMTIFDNIASSMRTKAHRQPEDVIEREVKRVAAMMNISELLDRKPAQASNGQRQRVALGRALVRHPNVFLMDEPLAHLDAKLRHAMRKELKSMQENFQATTIYVTHDYTEAMSLGDKIAVLNEGKVCQVGTPDEVYYSPATEFVAKLFGECEINIVTASLTKKDGVLCTILPFGTKAYPLPEDVAMVLENQEINTVDVGFYTQAIHYSRTMEEGCLTGTVYTNEPLGNKIELIVKAGEEFIRFTARINENFKIDDPIYMDLDMKKCVFFHPDTKQYIVRHKEN